jgi:hypothetical protein
MGDRVGHAGTYELIDRENHKLFRDTIFERFLIQFNPASGARVIMRRVDILEQRLLIVRRDRLGSPHMYSRTLALGDEPVDDRPRDDGRSHASTMTRSCATLPLSAITTQHVRASGGPSAQRGGEREEAPPSEGEE